MQRSHLTLGLVVLVAALWSTQCNSLSDDCKKTLTCGEDAGAPRLNLRDCKWRFPDGGEWLDGPRLVSGRWEWPNGEPAPGPNCTPTGGGGGSGGDDNCTDGVELNPRMGAVLCDPLYCDTASRNCVECLTDTHCSSRTDAGANAGTVCDPEIRRCVQCRNDRDCAGTDKPFCQQPASGAAQNECVSCLRNSDCGSTEVCDEPTGECTLRCSAAENNCRGDKPVCNLEAGICVECLNDTTCSGGTPECNTGTKQCVQCVTDTPCGALGRVCDTRANQCVRCTETEHCAEEAATPECDPAARTCVECLTSEHCTNVAESRCNPGTHTCETCTLDEQCEMAAPRCRVGDGRCVECRDDSHCPGSRCETTSGTCVECTSDADCPLVDEARCDVTLNSPTRFQCVGCTGFAECSGKTPGGLCRTNDGLCVNCLDNPGCVPSGPTLSRCSGAGNCAPCAVDADCDLFSTRRACRTNPINPGCVECVNDNHCINNSDGPRCKTVTGGGPAPINTCVECLSNADCTNPAESLCQNNACVPCTANAACSHLTNLGVCDTSQGAGVCVQCTGDQRQACGAFVCDRRARVCSSTETVGSAVLCESCISDDHCATSASCVEQIFGATELGFFCFPRSPEACTRPYVNVLARTNIDDEQVTVCMLRETTCSGLNTYGAGCAGPAGATNDPACGQPGLADGICAQGPLVLQCTIPCQNLNDCPAGGCTNNQCSL